MTEKTTGAQDSATTSTTTTGSDAATKRKRTDISIIERNGTSIPDRGAGRPV